ncbi:MAG: hypothetical protein ACPGD5_06420 [Salibacteraceae bacterium]
MPCEHCCGADQVFDLKTAKKERKRYFKKGPKGATKRILEALDKFPKKDKTLLDIGGGIGIIQWNHLEAGGSKTTHLDSSSGYQTVAKEIAIKKGFSDHSQFHFGDFVEIQREIKPHDFVTLDKVVCCYPDYEELLIAATKKCDETLALSFPMDGFIAKAFQKVGGLYMKYIERSAFRPFVHPVHKIDEVIRSNGFYLASQALSFPWHVRVYKRN